METAIVLPTYPCQLLFAFSTTATSFTAEQLPHLVLLELATRGCRNDSATLALVRSTSASTRHTRCRHGALKSSFRPT